MKPDRFFRAFVLLLVFLLVGCDSSPVEPVAPTSASTVRTDSLTYAVTRGTVSKNLDFAGRVAPAKEWPLYFETSGYVKRVLVQPGELVQAGDLLAELEMLQSAGQQSLITLAELDLVSAQVGFGETVAEANRVLTLARHQLSRTRALQGTYTGAVQATQVSLEQAQDQVTRAETEHREALERPWESQDVVDGYAFALQQARWNLGTVQAQHNQALAAQTAYQYDLRAAETAVEHAEAELKHLEESQESLPAIEVERARRALDWVKKTSLLTAPLDGKVISLSLYPGQLVQPYAVVMIIADPLDIEVSANPSEDELRELSEGQQVVVRLGVDPDRSWPGTVRRLPYPYGTGSGADALTGIARPVRIDLEEDTSGLKLGELVRIVVPLEERVDTLWLPPDAIRSFQGRPFVIVQGDTGQGRVDVEVGIEGQAQVEILSGLEEGQIVVAP